MSDFLTMNFDQMNNLIWTSSGSARVRGFPPSSYSNVASRFPSRRSVPFPVEGRNYSPTSREHARRWDDRLGRLQIPPDRPTTHQSTGLDYEELLALDDDLPKRGVTARGRRLLNYVAARRKDTECECQVCKDKIAMGSHLIKLPCLHVFHEGCVEKWFEDHRTCPICRKELEA